MEKVQAHAKYFQNSQSHQSMGSWEMAYKFLGYSYYLLVIPLTFILINPLQAIITKWQNALQQVLQFLSFLLMKKKLCGTAKTNTVIVA